VRVVPEDIGDDLQRFTRHRHHLAPRVEQSANQVEAGHGPVEEVPERDDEQVAERVAGEWPLSTEPVLEHVTPLVAPVAVLAQGRDRHPQVAGGQDVELLAQPARGTAIVSHRDDGGDRVGDVFESRQRHS